MIAGLGLGGLVAGEFPLVDGQLFDEILFGEVGGLPLGVEVLEESLEFAAVLHGEEGATGAEAVYKRVLGDAGLAFRRLRAGGMGGVLAISLDFEFRWHGVKFFPGCIVERRVARS